MTDAPLTPAEAFVLLDPFKSSGGEAFKIAFLTLIAQGVVRISMADRVSEALGPRSFRPPVAVVIRDPPGMFLAPEIVHVVRRAETSRWGATLSALGRNAANIYGRGLVKLKTRLILPALAARGLLAARTVKFLGLPVRTRYEDTPAGLEERRRIEMLLDDARRLPSLIGTSPGQAKAIALAAGPLLLLVPELRSIYGQLAELDPVPAEMDGADLSLVSVSDGSFDDAGAFDFAAFDMSALDLDFGAFDSSFDSSFADGGSDGGSDGGGDGGSDGGGGGDGGGDGGGGGE